jgi:hypothetical protein
MIHGDAMQPGGEPAPPLETAEMRHRLDENLLRRILRDLAPPDHAQREIENLQLMAAHECVERAHVARFRE